MTRVLAVLGLLAACGGGGRGPEAVSVDAVFVDGRAVNLLAEDPAAVVLVFVTPDCPISNRYVPEINRMAAEWAAQRVSTYLVYPDPAFSLEQIVKHRVEFELEPQGLVDFDQSLVRLTGVEVTPEAAVLTADGDLAYRGRIDNRFVDFGKTRPRATVRDLRLAVASTLEGALADPAGGPAVGCYIPPPPPAPA